MLHRRYAVRGFDVHIVSTERSDGSFALREDELLLAGRRRALGPLPWCVLRQVHGSEIVDADATSPVDPVEADGAVLFRPGTVASVLTADCAPVVLVGSTGVAVVHAGWRGLLGGVVASAASRLRAGGAEPVATFLGPCIGPSAYEFGQPELDAIVASFGPEVGARTADGRPALDLPRLVQISCEREGWPAPPRPDCTSDDRWFSHRTRADTGRQATIAWLEPTPTGRSDQ